MVEDILNIISSALNGMTNDYFHVPTTYNAQGIVRERVFCYELYHRMRSISDDRDVFKIHGEIDKRGHELFDKDDRKNPDFIFHIPATMHNFVVVEVKGSIIGKDYEEQTIKDFNTLAVFTHKYGYQLGVFILYNHTLSEFEQIMRERMLEWLRGIQCEPGKIVILCKKSKTSSLEKRYLSEVYRDWLNPLSTETSN